MSPRVRNIFALAGLIAAYGVTIWLLEQQGIATWGESFTSDPKAIFSRDHDRERMIEQEFDAPVFTPPADTMPSVEVDDARTD